jgi:signal transduction histidine kinase
MSGVVRRLMGVALELDMGVDLVDGEVELDRVQATQLYRLCHDVVSDAVRNRLARRIQIRIRRDGDRLVLEIRHDGSRPSVEETDSGSSVPFRLRYRARLLDAVVEVSETDSGETMTRCSLMVEGSGE